MTKRFVTIQVSLALTAMAIAAAVLYIAVTTDIIAGDFYPFKARVALGALVTIGGLSIWLVLKPLRFLVSRRGDVSYQVENAGYKESFKKKQDADARISALVSKGARPTDIKLTKITIRVDSNGSVVENTEYVPLASDG